MGETTWTPMVCECVMKFVGDGDRYEIISQCEDHKEKPLEEALEDIILRGEEEIGK